MHPRSRWIAVLVSSVVVCGCTLEAVPGGTEGATLRWIDSAKTALTTMDPAAPNADLAPLGEMVGTAHVVGMGEATHGTHEFFAMKHRVFRYLVEEKGFNAFAIEATLPEALALDRYVRTGQGDPDVLLSHLYFWTWNTAEVRDLIQWMRAWNTGKPAAQQVGFYGFDMQYPGVAMDSVVSFVARAAPDLAKEIGEDLGLCRAYANDDRGRFAHPLARGRKAYAMSGTTVTEIYIVDDKVQAHCITGINSTLDVLETNKDRMKAATSPAEYDMAVRLATVVSQWYVSGIGYPFRDRYMAENIEWWRRQLGTSARVFVWAHNGHISTYEGAMGRQLRDYYAHDYVTIGFAFDSGGFNAYNAKTGQLGPIAAERVPAGSAERFLSQISAPNYYFDIRSAPEDPKRWFDTSFPTRQIGAVYDPTIPGYGTDATRLSTAFDILMFVRQTTPSTLLPFVF